MVGSKLLWGLEFDSTAECWILFGGGGLFLTPPSPPPPPQPINGSGILVIGGINLVGASTRFPPRTMVGTGFIQPPFCSVVGTVRRLGLRLPVQCLAPRVGDFCDDNSRPVHALSPLTVPRFALTTSHCDWVAFWFGTGRTDQQVSMMVFVHSLCFHPFLLVVMVVSVLC